MKPGHDLAMRSCLSILLIAAIFSDSWNSVENQANKLGSREFTLKTWAVAAELERGELTASLLSKFDVTRLHRTDIEALLGTPTGYYDYDTNPAYFVGPNTVESMSGKAIYWYSKRIKMTATSTRRSSFRKSTKYSTGNKHEFWRTEPDAVQRGECAAVRRSASTASTSQRSNAPVMEAKSTFISG